MTTNTVTFADDELAVEEITQTGTHKIRTNIKTLPHGAYDVIRRLTVDDRALWDATWGELAKRRTTMSSCSICKAPRATHKIADTFQWNPACDDCTQEYLDLYSTRVAMPVALSLVATAYDKTVRKLDGIYREHRRANKQAKGSRVLRTMKKDKKKD